MTGENKEVDTTVLDKVSDKKTCPGGKVTCPQADDTCCQDGKGGYYCSPYKNVSTSELPRGKTNNVVSEQVRH